MNSVPMTTEPVRPTEFRIRQGGVIPAKTERGAGDKPWSVFEGIHDVYLAERLITIDAWHAGNKFIKAYYAANGSGVAAQSYAVKVCSSNHQEFTKAMSEARESLVKWHEKLAPSLFSCLESILGLGKAPSTYARDIGKHPTIGKELFISALEQFALST